jgi:omega-6 fatty acid desaturase (delta-12 desaturase)
MYFFGFMTFLLVHMLPAAITFSIGSYLFYAQHNFPDAKFKDRRQWDYHFAAMNSSSMFEMSKVMHWFTGNIGFHHIHHLNHRIPFYRLPEVMAALPEMQSPGRTSWAIKDVAACLRLALWDPEQQKLISHREADEIIASQAVAAAK